MSGKKQTQARKIFKQKAALIVVGILTLLYCLGELAVAVYTDSLALLSDGFHNLSDVIAIIIAYWALSVSQRGQSDEMTYGWKRTEVVGALVNGMFLLSLCLYIVLESIPRFIKPPDLGEHSMYFLITSGVGVGINILGAVILGIVGVDAHGHSHSHDHDHGHGHGHGHGHHHHHHEQEEEDENEEDQQHDIIYLTEDHHGHDLDHFVGPQQQKKQKQGRLCSRNIWAVFLHYVGDVLSSVCVLVAGLLMYFFPEATWPKYLDPVSSLVIVLIVFFSTIGLVRECITVLLQGVPKSVNMPRLRSDLKALESVLEVDDLHVWELGDGVMIATVHLEIEDRARQEPDEDRVASILKRAKAVFHDHDIHSATIQTESRTRVSSSLPSRRSICVEKCKEDWCCKMDDESSASFYSPSSPIQSQSPYSSSSSRSKNKSKHNHHCSHSHSHDHDHSHSHGDHDHEAPLHAGVGADGSNANAKLIDLLSDLHADHDHDDHDH